MARRRRMGLIPVLATLLLISAALAAVLALFMPWISVRGGFFALGGLIPVEPVAGYRIPALVREASDDPLVQGALATKELLDGRLDRFTARLLFGERYEEKWAPVVVAPALLALLATLTLRFRPPRLLLYALTAVGLVLTGGFLAAHLHIAAVAESGSLFSPVLILHAGVPVTIGACAATTLGCLLLATTVRR